MMKDLLNIVMAGFVAFGFPQLTVGLLNGADMLSGQERLSLAHIHETAKGALSGDPQKLAQLCPLMKQLVSAAGPDAKELGALCDAMANGGDPEQVMAIAYRAMDKLQVASR